MIVIVMKLLIMLQNEEEILQVSFHNVRSLKESLAFLVSTSDDKLAALIFF